MDGPPEAGKLIMQQIRCRRFDFAQCFGKRDRDRISRASARKNCKSFFLSEVTFTSSCKEKRRHE
ncbi:hypothetical protein NK8_25270 [Caballeronia sp. NK8]|nr:hypothetical protein NK8_25270 [Caballeronia sp. NK8]